MPIFLLVGQSFLFIHSEMLRNLGEKTLLLAVALAVLLTAAAWALGVLRWLLSQHQLSMRVISHPLHYADA